MSKTASSLRDRLLQNAGPRVHALETEQFGTVWVREMSGADRDRIQQLIKAHPDGLVAPGSDARLVAMFLCDEDGTRPFDIEKDVDQINELPLVFMREVITKGNRVSGLTEDAVDEAKANFPATPSDDSTSDSPATLAA
jgi:hypothetical protein